MDPLDSDFFEYVDHDGKPVKYRWFGIYEIINWSNNEEELKIQLDVNKYNI